MLYEKKLKYWKNEKDFDDKKHPKGILDFQMAQVHVQIHPKNCIDLLILGCDRIFHLRESRKGQFDTWVERL